VKFVNGLAVLGAIVGTLWLSAGAAFAQAPKPWQLGFQEAASPGMERIVDFNEILLYLIIAITVFVTGLLAYVCIRFRRKANPEPRSFSHNSLLEVLWTAIPVIILVLIAIPSLRLLYYLDRTPDAEMTIKAIGHQWYWSYEYPDLGDVSFDAVMLEDDELEEGDIRLLSTDTPVVVPVDTNIRLLTTADDVIHAWTIPAFGVKLDSVPGRVNETWFRATKVGVYYGQCSELCGTLHAFMPIEVKVVSKEEYAEWVAFAKVEYAQGGASEELETVTVANAEEAGADAEQAGKQ